MRDLFTFYPTLEPTTTPQQSHRANHGRHQEMARNKTNSTNSSQWGSSTNQESILDIILPASRSKILNPKGPLCSMGPTAATLLPMLLPIRTSSSRRTSIPIRWNISTTWLWPRLWSRATIPTCQFDRHFLSDKSGSVQFVNSIFGVPLFNLK